VHYSNDIIDMGREANSAATVKTLLKTSGL
jgi:hypothetical protein